MAAKTDNARKTEDAPKKKGAMALIGAVAVASLIAIGTGGGLGLYLQTTVEKAVDQKKKDEEDKAVKVLKYTGDLSLRSVGSVVTNLADATEAWVRLESSVVFKTAAVPSPDVALAEIRADITAYLRSVTTKQIEGPSGLQHLREDLNERVALRTKGQVRELIVESIVVQ